MGKYHVYFPGGERWLNTAPEWAKSKWPLYLEECTKWCNENRIPITIVDDGYVYEEKWLLLDNQ
jgi:hypothetical protein